MYEDILLYEKKTGKKFFDEDFQPWFSVAVVEKVETIEPYTGPQTEERVASYAPVWLTSFIQRAFMEAYATILDGDEVDKWIEGFSSIFSKLKAIGPYHDACASLTGTPSNDEKECTAVFTNQDYVAQCFAPAVGRATGYMKAGNEFYGSAQITEKERGVFLGAVADADLTSPLVPV